MMTRRGAGPEGNGGAAGAASGALTGAAATSAGAAGDGTTLDGAAGGTAAATETTGAEAAAGMTTGRGGGAATPAGRAATAAGIGAATTGGFAITGPTGGLLAIAGAGGGATIFAFWRGKGTILRGAGGVFGLAATGLGEATMLGVATATGAAGRPAGAATATAGADEATARGGTARTPAASACLRSRIAFIASPGFEMFDKSNFGFCSTACLGALVPRLLPLKWSRTLWASSASIELEWVFPVTPIASSASRMGLLFTSSSRARSLIRTLLIRPFSLPCALSWSYLPHRGRNRYSLYYY